MVDCTHVSVTECVPVAFGPFGSLLSCSMPGAPGAWLACLSLLHDGALINSNSKNNVSGRMVPPLCFDPKLRCVLNGGRAHIDKRPGNQNYILYQFRFRFFGDRDQR